MDIYKRIKMTPTAAGTIYFNFPSTPPFDAKEGDEVEITIRAKTLKTDGYYSFEYMEAPDLHVLFDMRKEDVNTTPDCQVKVTKRAERPKTPGQRFYEALIGSPAYWDELSQNVRAEYEKSAQAYEESAQ